MPCPDREPRTRHTHTHRCAVLGCMARVPCDCPPIIEGGGDRDAEYTVRACPTDPSIHRCAEHDTWIACPYCGMEGPPDTIDADEGCPFCAVD